LIKADANGTKQWDKTLGIGYGEFVQQTNDGGYVIVAYPGNKLIKTDANGTEQWNRTYNGGTALDGCRTNDGGYMVIAGSHLYKTDENGIEEWNKTIEGSSDSRSIQQTNDGGYIIAGRTFIKVDRYIPELGMHLNQVRAGWLVKTDSNGNTQWNKTFENHLFYSVKQTFDGGYIIGSNEEGFVQESGNYEQISQNSLIKINSNGNMQWHADYSSDGNWFTVLQTTDGGYVMAVYNNLYKTDNEGNKLWNKTYDDKLGIHSALQTDDGGYIMSGTYNTHEDNDSIFLLKTVGRK
jgi:hypothetical protein